MRASLRKMMAALPLAEPPMRVPDPGSDLRIGTGIHR